MPVKNEYTHRLEFIRPKIRYGDYARIADLCGFTADYVKRVLSLNDKRFNVVILEQAEQYYASIEQLHKSVQGGPRSEQ